MQPKKSLSESYQLFFQNLFNFNGRTRRSDYWRVVILNGFIVGFISGVITGALGEESAIGGAISSLLSLALTVLHLGIAVRRLHDAGKEWTYLLFSLIPFVGWIIVFVALLKDSEPGDNKFGPNPKYAGAPAGTAYQPPVQQYQPVQPTYQPPQPAEPVQPVYQPPQPAEPVQPVYQPPQPAEPAQPVYQPPQPAEQPYQPSYQPTEPATYQPVEPTFEPAEPEYDSEGTQVLSDY